MPIVDDPEIRRERSEFAHRQGEYWTKVHAEALSKLPDGTAVVINVVTGDIVTGHDWLAARTAFEQRFGKGTTISWSFVVGRPYFVGGGLWQS